jgi:hypothetical protein
MPVSKKFAACELSHLLTPSINCSLLTDNETTFVAKQRIINKHEYTAAASEQLSKHVPAATDTHATKEWCFLRGLCLYTYYK